MTCKSPMIRIGNGYDMHRLVAGRPLILGGVKLSHPEGLGLDGIVMQMFLPMQLWMPS